MYDDYADGTFVSVEECAKRMNLTTDEVWDLVESRALHACRYGGWGDLLVEPALVNVLPAPKRKG
jgi:hypothetical protein